MNLFKLVAVMIIFTCAGCSTETDSVGNNPPRKVEREIKLTVLTPEFDSTNFNGDKVYAWRGNNIQKPLVGLTASTKGVVLPTKTEMISADLPDDGFMSYTMGIGKILLDKEKRLLPNEIIDEIRKLYSEY